MKKNISINISGIIFNIEEDGYERLKTYLDEIKRYFATYDDTGEIAADIENRVAEIFLSKLNPQKQVITARDVDSLIAKMGNVKDFEAIEEPEEARTSHTTSGTFGDQKVPELEEDRFNGSATENIDESKRLYRDGKRKVIAGVASGIAHYFKIDPFWIRLLFLVILLDLFLTFSFSSILLIGYIVIWIIVPERFDLAEDKKIKKMFRNPDDKVIGGVASGLAAFFGVEPTLIRILFILTLFVGGSGLIAYLILWIITPEAKTLTDKMQMQGEPVTLSNIEFNIKKNLNVREGAEKTLVKVILLPFRLISAIFSGAGRAISPLIKFLGDLIRIVAGIVLIIMGFGFLFSLITAGSIATGIFPQAYIDLFELDIPVALVQNSLPPLLITAGFITLFIPGLMIILVGIAIMAKRWLLNTAASWVLFALWIISILTFAFTLPAFIVDFKTRGSYETASTFVTDSSHTIVLDLRKEKSIDFNEIDFSLKPTNNSEIKLEKRFWARGRNEEAAIELAKQSIYLVEQKGDTLLFSQNLDLPENTPFREQELQATLYMPIGQKFSMDYSMRKILSYSIYQHGFSTDDLRHKNIFVFNEAGELECLNCPERTERTPQDVAHEGYSREIGAEDFSNVSAGNNFKLYFTQAPEYSIKIVGEEDIVESLEFEQDGNTIHFRSDFSLFEQGKEPVQIYISLPDLEHLDLSGAAEAELKDWSADQIDIDLSGASLAKLEGTIEEVSADLSGSSEIRLQGNGQKLSADLSGSSRLEALDFKIREAALELSGASFAGVHTNEQLRVEASGASQIKYRGNPEVESDVSRGSRVEKQKD